MVATVALIKYVYVSGSVGVRCFILKAASGVTLASWSLPAVIKKPKRARKRESEPKPNLRRARPPRTPAGSPAPPWTRQPVCRSEEPVSRTSIRPEHNSAPTNKQTNNGH